MAFFLFIFQFHPNLIVDYYKKLFLKALIYLFGREREQGEGQREKKRESEADTPLNAVSDTGLDLTTLRS